MSNYLDDFMCNRTIEEMFEDGELSEEQLAEYQADRANQHLLVGVK